MSGEREDARDNAGSDSHKAAGFFLLHAAIFILVPLIVAGVAVWWQFG
jgi:hypothetical protein